MRTVTTVLKSIIKCVRILINKNKKGFSIMNNKRIREELVRNQMFLWELAKMIGVSESTMTRMMREELPDARQDELIDLIRKGAKRDDN